MIKVIERHEEAALEVITNLIINESVNAEVASEALRWIGDMRHEPTHENRLNLLEQSLNCSSIKVRDGAVLGLSFLDDPRAIDSIKEAMKRENSKLLYRNMEQVLEQLEGKSCSKFIIAIQFNIS